MSYFRDFSRYSYFEKHACSKTFNIGWLDPAHKFRTGELPEDFKDKLWKYCTHPVVETRGLHPCFMCEKYPVDELWNGAQGRLGYAEIRVFGANGEIYAAPNMIFHYVHAHHYRPPTEFVDAVLEAVPPPSLEYVQKLKGAHLDPDMKSGMRALLINRFYCNTKLLVESFTRRRGTHAHQWFRSATPWILAGARTTEGFGSGWGWKGELGSLARPRPSTVGRLHPERSPLVDAYSVVRNSGRFGALGAQSSTPLHQFNRRYAG